MVISLSLCACGMANANVLPGTSPHALTVFVDESGAPALVNGVPDPGFLLNGVLTYTLPEDVFSGDVLVYEAPPGNTDLSDILRFLPNDKGGFVGNHFQWLS